jgi:hypothetical protein
VERELIEHQMSAAAGAWGHGSSVQQRESDGGEWAASSSSKQQAQPQ